jgi:menaquinone-dependent protoporphyrinogen oxidase
MKILVLYASRHGHTRRIAEFLAEALSKRGWDAEVRDVASDPVAPIHEYAGAILASPIHIGRHAKSLVSFARRHHEALTALPSAFVSVSLTQITAESATADAEKRRQAHEALSVVLGGFIEATGWHPRDTLRVAGALAYTRYNWLVRWIIKRIARAEGGSTDTSRDHVYTNWDAIDGFADAFVGRLAPRRDATVAEVGTRVG